MNRKHALAISLLLGLAVAAGAFAATRDGGETGPDAGAGSLAGTAPAGEQARLRGYERTLDRLLARAGRGPSAAGGAPAGALVATAAPGATHFWDDDDHGHGHDDDRGRHGHDDDRSGHGHGRGGDDDHDDHDDRGDDDDHDHSGHGHGGHGDDD